MVTKLLAVLLKKVRIFFVTVTECDPLALIALPYWFSHICQLDLSGGETEVQC